MNEKENFTKTSYVLVKKFIDEDAIKTVSLYLENSLNRGFLCQGDVSSGYAIYADPLIEVILLNSVEDIEKIVSKKLYPSYSYARIYTEGNKLVKHIDRPSCEYSVTVNVATNGGNWPIWVQSKGNTPEAIVLEPGDAVVYKGCEVFHWRDAMEETNTNLLVQFMLHYVDQDGLHAECKFDNRPKLGLNATERSK